MRYIKRFSLLIALAMAACVITTRSLPTAEELPSAGESDREALNRGRALAVTECAECHRFYWPEEYDAKQWEKIIHRMAPLSSLNKGQSKDLKGYMTTAAEAVRPGRAEQR